MFHLTKELPIGQITHVTIVSPVTVVLAFFIDFPGDISRFNVRVVDQRKQSYLGRWIEQLGFFQRRT